MGNEAKTKAFEVELLTSSARRDPSRVQMLLHEDFVEIGRSGRRWTRDELVASLGEEGDRPAPETDDWTFSRLSSDLVLVTYRIRAARGEAGMPRSGT